MSRKRFDPQSYAVVIGATACGLALVIALGIRGVGAAACGPGESWAECTREWIVAGGTIGTMLVALAAALFAYSQLRLSSRQTELTRVAHLKSEKDAINIFTNEAVQLVGDYSYLASHASRFIEMSDAGDINGFLGLSRAVVPMLEAHKEQFRKVVNVSGTMSFSPDDRRAASLLVAELYPAEDAIMQLHTTLSGFILQYDGTQQGTIHRFGASQRIQEHSRSIVFRSNIDAIDETCSSAQEHTDRILIILRKSFHMKERAIAEALK